MGEKERGILSEERRAYLEGKIIENFSIAFDELSGDETLTMNEIGDVLEKTRFGLNRDRPESYPEGASVQDALMHLVFQVGYGRQVNAFALAMYFGELNGAGGHDPERINSNWLGSQGLDEFPSGNVRIGTSAKWIEASQE